MAHDYYVYEHREADTGRSFYVGKGRKRRAFVSTSRNKYWKHVAEKHGFLVKILYEGLSQSQANEIEQKLILAYGRENLCNLTDGGDGIRNPSTETIKKMSDAKIGSKGYWTGKKRDPIMVAIVAKKLKGRIGPTGEKHHRFGKSNSLEHNKAISEYMKSNKRSEQHKANISKAKSGPSHHMFDHREYSFEHEDGTKFTGTQFSFRNKFNLGQGAVRRMVLGLRKSKLKGWSHAP